MSKFRTWNHKPRKEVKEMKNLKGWPFDTLGKEVEPCDGGFPSGGGFPG